MSAPVEQPYAGPGGLNGSRPLHTVSLRWRASVAVLLVVLVVLVGLTVAVDRTFAAQATRNASNLLAGRAQLARQLARAGSSPQQLVNRVDTRGVRASLVLVDGRELGTPPPPEQRKLITRVTLSGPGRVDGARLTLAADTSFIDSAQQALRRSLVITGIVALLLTAVLVALAMRLALRPLDAFASLARDVIGGARGGRLHPTRTDTELGQAAGAVDGMLDALEGAELHARDAEGEARAAASRSQEFLADAAHELRTPIAGVQAAAETLMHQGSALTETDREHLLVLLVREAQRAGRLTGDLLTTARLDTGVEVDRQPVDVDELLRAEVDRTALLQPGSSISLTGHGPVIISDQAKIRSIVGNVLGNAVKAAGPQATIGVAVRSWNGQVQVMFTDDGPGIPAHEREHVFQRLVRLDRSRNRTADDAGISGPSGSGSGLGLAISRGYARALGGDLICIDPPPGVRGATFLLTLPA